MDAIEYGFIEAKTTALRNPVDESLKSLITALNDCDIDMKTALVTDPTTKQKLSLAVAFQNKILITVDYPITFKEAVASGSLDLDAGVYTDPKNCVKYSLEDAIKNEILDPSSAVVKDPLNQEEAIMKGLIDVKKKAIFDSSVGKLKSLCILYEENIAIFLREPISFDCAVESHALNTLTAKFTDPISGEELPFSSACLLGLIDPDSAYVKDTSKKELLNLTQALERGIISNEKGHIIDTEESKLYNISKAIENSIIMTPKVKFSLFDILSYNLYDANSQTIENPYSQNKISFIDALDQGVVDDESAAVKCPSTGQVNDLRTSISLNILDPVTGALIKDDATKFSLPEAKKYGYILPTHLRIL
ncbi:hypothetical protein Avbf_05112 [Armadillidium vulgare]|nr:hypothetical protein Avbf_05112 [Armadillidium vulgare]